MKKLIYIIVFCPLFSFSQNITDFGFDKISITNSTEVINAEIIAVTSKPIIKMDRFYFWYKGNTINATQGGYSGQLLNGKYNAYHLNKNLKEQGIFKDGLKDGIWQTWTENGLLSEACHWKRGQRSGMCITYDSRGKVKTIAVFKCDTLVSHNTSSFWKRINLFKKKHKPL